MNKALKRAHYCMLTIDNVLPNLDGTKVFSTVDAKDGFWQLKPGDETSRLTCFESSFGRYKLLRLPLSLIPSPELFQERNHNALVGIKGISCIADDILIAGSGDDEAVAMADHNRNLRALMQRCREKVIKLNKPNLKLNRDITIFCGHELTRNGV